MVKVRIVSREEAQNTRKSKTPGVRRQRMMEFDAYARELLDHPDQAVIYEELGENPQKFVLSLRAAFKRAKAPVVVRKMRGRDEVRAWLGEPGRAAPASQRRSRVAK
jgi:hypothetical protein